MHTHVGPIYIHVWMYAVTYMYVNRCMNYIYVYICVLQLRVSKSIWIMSACGTEGLQWKLSSEPNFDRPPSKYSLYFTRSSNCTLSVLYQQRSI